jgi:hypothetical protein
MPEKNDPWNYYPFIKWYPKNWLRGSIRFDCTPEERSVFIDLVCMASESRNRGVIQANADTPYTHKYIADQLCIPRRLLERCLEKFTEQKRVQEDDKGIKIINFDYYQGLDTRGRGRPGKDHPEQLPLSAPEPHDRWQGEPGQKSAGLWQEALKRIEGEVSKGNYQTWYQNSVGLSCNDGKFVVGVPSDSIASYFEQSQKAFIERALINVVGMQVKVEFQIFEQHS